jgi:predicted nucleotide-binding protein
VSSLDDSPDVSSLDDSSEDVARRREEEAAREAKLAAWRKSRPAVELALDEFLKTAQWPQRERFRRKLTQRELDDLSPEEMLAVMPRSFWERNMAVPDRVILSLQALQELPKAEALLGVCMAMVRRAYRLYSSDTDDELKLRSDDPFLLSAAGGDAGLLLCALEVLDQHPPSPLGGGGSNPDSGTWFRELHEAVMPAFRDVTTVKDYLAAQAGITNRTPMAERVQAEKDKRAAAVPGSLSRGATEVTRATSNGAIFVVHGHALAIRHEVVRVLERATGRNVIVLHEQANAGRTILEKFEGHAAGAAFAVVLLTADDEGGIRASGDLRLRSRQNVIFELGFFFGKLGRQRVAVLLEENVERPSDIDGLVYITVDRAGAWRYTLARELDAADISVDRSRIP